MAKLRGAGWLVQKRKGARGRLSVNGLDLSRILQDTRAFWPLFGTDFAERMQPDAPLDQSCDSVVPRRAVPPPDGAGQGPWAVAQEILHTEAPMIYGITSERGDISNGRLTQAAGSAFQATCVETHYQQLLLSPVRRADSLVQKVKVIS